MGAHDFSKAQAATALAWLVDAGVDVAVDASPRRWLADPTALVPVAAPPPPKRVAAAPAATVDLAAIEAAPSLDALRAVAEAIRATPIFADGVAESGVMIVGESPSGDDDRTGRPFSGPSGRLLDRMLGAIGLDRSRCYLTNLLLWRGAGGGKPGDADIALGRAILRRHVALARPRALLVMGGLPGQALLDTDVGITRLRGRWLDVDAGAGAVPVLPTFNPAYLLRAPAQKGLAWIDLLAFQSRIAA